MATIFWFRQDLRVSDNPGLFEAVQNGTVIPVYILDEAIDTGEASRVWLHHSLLSLNKTLNHSLNVYSGNALDILLKLAREYQVNAIYWNRCYEPARIKEDTHIKTALKNAEIIVKSFSASLLFEPWEILKADNTPYKVYTPFYHKVCLESLRIRVPLPAPQAWELKKDSCFALTIDQLGLVPEKKWPMQMMQKWSVGENAAQKNLKTFLDLKLNNYKNDRDYPSKEHTSYLSPHLHFGEISPHQIWHTLQYHAFSCTQEADIEHFKKELVWREFSSYWLYYFPEMPDRNFHQKFDHFPWEMNQDLLKKWQKGLTGYPIVDAGMRELWQTGYMHNRVRMIVASFLVKNLKIHWTEGAKWFWNCLLDADLANNSASWQWVAGSGLDAAPYFRIFNPVTQGEKFDSEGAYVRRFLPELAKLPNKFIFKPWEAPSNMLNQANIILGKDYPFPIVDLKDSREKALAGYQKLNSHQAIPLNNH